MSPVKSSDDLTLNPYKIMFHNKKISQSRMNKFQNSDKVDRKVLLADVTSPLRANAHNILQPDSYYVKIEELKKL